MADHKLNLQLGQSRLISIDANDAVMNPPGDLLVRLDADIASSGGEMVPTGDREGAIGATMFDLPNSEDNTVTVLLPREYVQASPSQALVRIKSSDERSYIGIVTAGPFAEPDSLRGDSHMLVTVATRGGIYLPPYHGRVQVAILGEELSDGTLTPPRLRPLPNSPVFALDDAESASMLHAAGDIRLGVVMGHDSVVVGVPSDQKAVLPRHTAVLGTTGSGKSTTVARLVSEAQAAGMAVIVLDVEGEYTFLHEPTDDSRMLAGLQARELKSTGIPADKTTLFHLVGRETANPNHPHRQQFSLQFENISPYQVIEILGLNDAQQERFLKAYEVAKAVMRDLNVFPTKGNADEERLAMELDEFEQGYPRLTLPLMIDFVSACLAEIESQEFAPRSEILTAEKAKQVVSQHIRAVNIPKHPVSWKALLGRLWRLNRIKVFDSIGGDGRPIAYETMLRPGQVSIIDLSNSGASELNNIVIADLLRGLQQAQDETYQSYEEAKRAGREMLAPSRVLLVIEEAHEFLSGERIEKMQILFQQVARIAKRGRKRWLGLVFVTQLPQHLPRQVFGLVNSYVLHKVTDPQVVNTLQRTVSGIDDSLWRRLPGLAPGQAIVSFPHMTRPLLVSMDPTPAKLRMVD